MRQNKFKKGDIINNLIILDKDKIVTTNNGSKKHIGYANVKFVEV